MQHKSIEYRDLSTTVKLAAFNNNAATEGYALIELCPGQESNVQTQFRQIEDTLLRMAKLPDFSSSNIVWKRYFVSDAINQASFICQENNIAVSVVQQPPLNGTKVALFIYFVSNSKVQKSTENTILKRPHYEHFFHTQMNERKGSVEEQTKSVFESYSKSLKENDCTLKDNCVRTWIYVQDVDVQYAGMVSARNEIFSSEKLTSETHFIASTGIEGRYIYPEVLMLMEAYAVKGISERQIKYLYAPTHLNPTYEYGVAFERGTAVDYGDRRHVYISGTASINNKGEVVHLLDIEKQIDRTIENIQTLLNEADTQMEDIGQMIIYLRDTADYLTVKNYFDKYYPQIPWVIVLAPVCRPGWLIEIECIAIKGIDNQDFRPF